MSPSCLLASVKRYSVVCMCKSSGSGQIFMACVQCFYCIAFSPYEWSLSVIFNWKDLCDTTWTFILSYVHVFVCTCIEFSLSQLTYCHQRFSWVGFSCTPSETRYHAIQYMKILYMNMPCTWDGVLPKCFSCAWPDERLLTSILTQILDDLTLGSIHFSIFN